MLQVFHVDFAKVDWDVVYVVMATHMLQASAPNVSAISDVCLHVFYLSVVYV
jgi:hypothetical protein